MSASLADPRALTRLYDQLARCNWWLRRLRGARAGEDLAMRKRLRPGTGDLAGIEDLSTWIRNWIDLAANARCLDLGAGFGETLFSLARACPEARCLGLGISGYQLGRARQQARQLGLADRCSFLQQSFERPVEGEFDLILAIETLFHAADLDSAIGAAAGQLAPGGALLLVEDMCLDAGRQHPAAAELSRRWATPVLHRRQDYLAAAARHGLKLVAELDLSAQLCLAEPQRGQRSRRRLRRLRACMPLGRRLVDAFLGGLAMEELHRAGLLEYRVMRFARGER